MTRLLLAVALAGLAMPACAADFEAPLLPAAKGRMQCYSPDAAHKTCKSMAGFRISSHGGIENIATVLISGSPPVMMESITPVEITGGKVCSQVSERDFQSANITVDGRPADLRQAQQYVHQAMSAAKNLIGSFVCVSFVTEGDAVKAKTTINGTAKPDLDQPVIWVTLDDGYKVGP
jgi:hypothetical protein